ncbi:MAG TPA: hypothetical protein VHB21_19690, partial [Minicystis sp.]|nr:hypothetical protein [Minicystis sp.]
MLCAFCGQSDCPGCGLADETGSGVIAIVPWERPGAGVFNRLFATASAATHGAEAFFSALPDGEVSPAMRFAVLAEMLAVASMAVFLVPLAAIALPSYAATVVQDPGLRASAARWIAVGVPALALWMVAAHATHGAALDVGARRQGAHGQRRRAVRYGLYACGWDLMSGPLGALWTLFGKGRSAVRGLLDVSMTVPGRSANALLQGVYALTPAETARARRAGTIAAVVITLLSGL